MVIKNENQFYCIIAYYYRYTVVMIIDDDSNIWTLRNFFKIGPNDLSFFQKLEGLFCWTKECWKKIADGRNGEENSEGRLLQLFSLSLSVMNI